MTTMNDLLIQRIIAHEGSIAYAYQDSLGYWTIGVGRLIDERKGGHLSQNEIEYLLINDLMALHKELLGYSWYQGLDDVRKDAIVELCFNMGLPHLLCFKHMIDALSQHDYMRASQELLLSEWAKQVGTERVADLHHRLLTGSYG